MGREGEREGRREERDQLCALINLQYPSVNHMFDDINLVCENSCLFYSKETQQYKVCMYVRIHTHTHSHTHTRMQ